MSQWKSGMKHSIPVDANFTLFKYINITPSFNYTERWYTNKVKQHYDDRTRTVVKDTINGFNRVFDYNMAVSLNTKLYGMYKPLFMKSKEMHHSPRRDTECKLYIYSRLRNLAFRVLRHLYLYRCQR